MKYSYKSYQVTSGKKLLKNYIKGKILWVILEKHTNKILNELEQEITGDDIDQCCYVSIIMKENEARAFTILHSLMHNNFPLAYYFYGEVLKYGKTFSKDPKEIVSYFNKTLELIPNFAPSLYDLGLCYLEGYGVKKNISTGIDLITKASKLGYATSSIFLSEVYSKGEYGYKINHKMSYKILKKIYKYSYEGRFKLAYKQIYSLGCTNKRRQGVKNYEYLVKKYNDIDCALNLGIILSDDRFSLKNLNKAEKYLRIAANDGKSGAMFKLAEIFMVEYGRNAALREQGIEWLKKSARLGNENAQKVANELNIKY